MSPLTLSRQRHRLLIEGLGERTPPLLRSRHFSVYALDGRQAERDPDDILVVHDFTAGQIDNNVAAHVADELLPLLARLRPPSAVPPSGYAYSENQTFERYVGAIVRSMDGNERRAWHRFYDNTLAALQAPAPQSPGLATSMNGTADFIAAFRVLYGRVAELAAEVAANSILDVATCFGFLPLTLAGQSNGNGHGTRTRIVGCDLNPALVTLAEDYRRQRRVPGTVFIRGDILSDDAVRELDPTGAGFDVVTAIHLLEHLTEDETLRAMDALWALSGRRLIIAVPFETVPDARFGHRRIFDRESLHALERHVDGRPHVFEDHGGWLVIDRPHGSQTQNQREALA